MHMHSIHNSYLAVVLPTTYNSLCKMHILSFGLETLKLYYKVALLSARQLGEKHNQTKNLNLPQEANNDSDTEEENEDGDDRDGDHDGEKVRHLVVRDDG